jgi:predicted RecA/RadA family phage recombinase
MADKEKIKVFYSPNCGHCKPVVDMIQSGNVVAEGNDGAEVELINTDQGDIQELLKEGISLVPTARYKGKTCNLLVDDAAGKVIFQCDKVEPPITTESEAIQP